MKTINVNLPKDASNKVLISISIPFGYFNESDFEFGLAHLAEHYIVKCIEKSFNLKDVSAEISDESINFYISLKKDSYKRFLETDLDNTLLKISENINSELLDNEKKRIEIEIEEKYSDSFKKLSQIVESSFISSPDFINRDRLNQIKNIKKFGSKNVSDFIEKLARMKKNIFVGYTGNKNDYNKSTIHLNKLSYKVQYKTGKAIFENTHPIFKKTNNFAVCFKGFNANANYTDRICLSILVREIYNRFNKEVRDFGVYSADFKNLVASRYGIVWFSTSSYTKDKIDIEKIFHKTVEEILCDKAFFKKLVEIKKDRKNKEKETWNKFYSRFDWVFNDMNESGKNIELSEVIKSINEVNKERIIRVAKKIFNPKNSLVLKSK